MSTARGAAPPTALPLSVNAAASLGAYLAAVLITFLLSPYMIRVLGDGRYGAWSLIAELTGYASLLDLGLRGAVTYFVAFQSGRRDEEAVRTFVASAFWALAGMGALAVAAGVALAAVFPALFDTGALDRDEIFWSMSALALTIGLSMPCSLLHSVLAGYRRQAFANAADIAARAAAAVAMALALHWGGGLVEIGLITLAGRVLAWSVQAWMMWSAAPELSLAPAWFRRGRLRELAGYGSKTLVINVAMLVIHRVDLIVVGLFAGIDKVTVYTLGAMLVIYLSQLVSSVTQAYSPYFSQDSGANEAEQIRRRFAGGLRLGSLLTGVLAGGLVAFAQPFLALWVGERFVSGHWTARSDTVMLILLAAQFPRILQSVSWQLLLGTRRVSFLMWLNVAEAAANLAGSLILVRYFGLAGVALGTLLPSLVAHAVLMPRYVTRTCQITTAEYAWHAPRAGYLAGLVTAAAGLALTHWLPPVTWAHFFPQAAAAALAGAWCGWALGLRPEDRERLSAWLRRSP